MPCQLREKVRNDKNLSHQTILLEKKGTINLQESLFFLAATSRFIKHKIVKSHEALACESVLRLAAK